MTVVDAPSSDVVVTAAEVGSPAQPAAAASSPSRGPGRSSVGAWAAAAVAVLAGWFVLQAFVLSGFQEHSTQVRLYGQLRNDLAAATAPVAAPIQPGAPVALISAPAAGVHDVVVVEGTTASQLTRGPGHLSDTVLPGQSGVSVLLGRSVTYGAPFRHIASLRPGERLRVTTGQGSFTYQVRDVRTPGAPLPPLVGAGQSRLTLVSSAATGWRSGWAPQHAVYVDCLLVGKAQPAPGGLPGAVSSDNLPMRGDATALVPLVLWLQALLAVAVGLVWCLARWSRWPTWVVGFPLVSATLWAATGAAMLLLPNLY